MQSAADAPSNSRAVDEPAVSAGRLGRQLQHACSVVFKAGMLMCSLHSALVNLTPQIQAHWQPLPSCSAYDLRTDHGIQHY